MTKQLTLLLGLMLIKLSAFAQLKLDPKSDAYNYKYDTLVQLGDKGSSSALMLGVGSKNAMALMFYNRAIEKEPENPYAYERRGHSHLSFDKLEEAADDFTQCLELNPENVQCIYGMFSVSAKGSTNYKLDQVPLPMMKQIYSSASAFIKVAPENMADEVAYAELLGYAFKLGIDNPEVYKKYVTILMAKEVDATIAQLAEEIIPAVQVTNNNPVLANLYDKLSQFNFYNDNDAKAKEYGQKGLATGYAYTTTYYYLGYTYYYTDNNPTEAIKILEEGLKKKGKYDRSTNVMASILYKEGKKAYLAKDYAGTINYFGKYTNIRTASERGNAFLGFAYYNTKKYAEATKALKLVKENANPDNVNIHYPNLNALIAFAEKPSTTTPAPAIKTLLIEVEKAEDIYTEGDNLAGKENYEQAIVKYNEALTYFTSINDKPSIELCYNALGLSYHDSKNYETAKEYYNKSIALGKPRTSSYTNCALLMYAIDGNYDGAEKLLDQGLTAYPENESINNMKGRMYIAKAYDIYDTKDYAAAIPFFEKGLELRGDAEAYIFLGFSYNGLKKMDEALEAWQNAFYMNGNLANTYPEVYKYVQSKE